MPNRLWSCVASPERWSPCPDSTMICAMVHPAGVPVLLLALERRLDHLVGDVGRQPLEGGFGRFVFPEPEKGAHDLGDCEHGEQKRHDRREHARHGDSDRRDRAHDRALAAGGCRSLRSPGRCLADGRMLGLRGSALTEGPRLGMLCGPFQRAFRLRGGSSLLGGGMPCDDGACAAEGVARLSDAGELPRSRPPRTRRHRRSRA